MEIKHKAIGLDKNEWVYGYVAFDSKKENAVIIHKQANNEMQHTAVDPETVCVFTGFLDKKGTDIYIRDLTMDGHADYPYVREVYWDDRFGYAERLVINGQFSGSLSNDKYIVPEECRNEVVGNTIDNPELLTKINVNN